MANIEILGALCAGIASYQAAGSRCADRGRLTRAEIAGLLSGLSRIEVDYLWSFAGDEDSEKRLIAHVRVWCAGLAADEHWQIEKGRPTVWNMSALAVRECVRPNRCVKCSGRGVVGVKSCAVCGGSGYKYLSNRQIAEAILIDECNFRRIWKGRYDQVISYLRGIESRVNGTIMFNSKNYIDTAAKVISNFPQ